MTGNTEEAASVAYRKRRVRRIKRIIVGTCIALLILPTILTIILMIKVFSLEKEVAELLSLQSRPKYRRRKKYI